MANLIQSKRFVVRQSLIGKDTNVEFTNKKGTTITYSHDKAFEIMKDTLESLACWEKYKSYTSSGNVPKAIRETEAIISQATTEVVVDEVVEETEDITSEEMTLEGAF
tara:strand:+ start:185 stop:508 length:324 start_codon:yes stop_codon:yes gene_type:complete